MFLVQGWKKQPDGSLQVAALAISPCTNGMAGWQMHKACYAPDRGQTLQNATWTFMQAGFSVHSLLITGGINEMLLWEDTQTGGDLKSALNRIEVILSDIERKMP